MGTNRTPNGTERVDDRGYTRIKVDGKWKLKHRHFVEVRLGRRLRGTERVYFKDNDKTNFADDNLVVKDTTSSKRPSRIRASIAVLTRKRDELNEIIAGLEGELEPNDPPQTTR